jgi:rhodanese-related sulfurtransferase
MKKLIIQLLIIIIVSVSIALIYNSSLDQPLPIIKKYDSVLINSIIGKSQVKTDNLSFKTISGEELFNLLNEDQMIIIDARQQLEFELGRIPGAINVPIEKFEVEYTKFSGLLKKYNSIVTYCSEMSCTDSELLAQKLIELGFTTVSVYKGGYDEWLANGYPIEKAPEKIHE